MAMEWTEETIARLRDLWQQGLSTAEIGRQLSVTKNAVVGKAHRLGLKPRPSPIRRAPKGAPAEAVADTSAPAAVTESAPVAPSVAKEETVSAPVVSKAPAPQPEKAPAPSTAAPTVSTAMQATSPASAGDAPTSEPEPAARPARSQARAPRSALRPVSEPRRRSSQSCCWPLGDPGTPGFHFCGATPLPGKPYCAEHAQLAYVKLRDRRDNVA